MYSVADVCEHVGTSRMILGVVEVISIKYQVLLGELGEKHPQMPA